MSRAHEITWWGGFDPNTFGVWISLDKVFDLPDSHKAAFLFMRSLVAPPSDDHQDYLRKLSSTEDRFIAYTAFTVFQHEWRHWYDLTSTPLGLCRTSQLAAFYSTMAGAYEEVAGLPMVYSPLIRWLRSSNLVNAVYPDIGGLPPLTATQLEHALMLLKKADKPLRATTLIDGKEISTTQILESLAMLRQEQAIEESFGVEAVRLVRDSIMAKKGGESYYGPISLIENTGVESRSIQTQILESAFFANYGVFGSQCPITPPEILKELLEGLGNESGNVNLINALNNFKVLGFTRREAFAMTYAVMKKTLDQILSKAVGIPDQSSHAARVLNAFGAGLPSAFLMGGAARFGKELDKEIPGVSSFSTASPYDFYPLLYVEGYPGLTIPKSLKLPIFTLAGIEIKSKLDYLTVMQDLNFKGSNPFDDFGLPGPYTMHVVWTPKPEKIASLPPYFSIFNVFHELMYWRGLIFGQDSMSPFTYWCTTGQRAEQLEQTIVC